MKLIRNFFLVFIIYAFCSACKSSKMAYDFPSVGEKKDLGGFQIDCLKNGLKLESNGPKKRMKNSIECLKDLKGIGDLI